MEAFVKQVSTYSVRINGYSRIFEATARLYRNAVDFFIVVCEQEWDTVRTGENLKARKSIVEGLSVKIQYRGPVLCPGAHTKPLPATVRQLLEAKVPSAVKRSTCTLSTLISLNAVLAAYAAGGLSHGCMVERKSDPLKGTAGNGGIGSTRLLVV